MYRQLNTQTHTERETTVTDDCSSRQSLDHTSRLLLLLVIHNDDVVHLSTGCYFHCYENKDLSDTVTTVAGWGALYKINTNNAVQLTLRVHCQTAGTVPEKCRPND